MSTFDSKHAAHLHRHIHSHVPSDPALRVKALESLAVEKGLISSETIDAWVEAYSEHIGPMRGAKVVARAWVDPDFKARLLADATEAIKEFGFEGNATGHLKAIENTDAQHNMVVCTLCSCYPWPVLGLPPAWYKSSPYRSRAVIDPRGVLAEFGTVLDDDVEVKVWDSTSEVRFLVLPERPEGTEGWTMEQLIPLVSRNSMIGVEKARPASGAAE